MLIYSETNTVGYLNALRDFECLRQRKTGFYKSTPLIMIKLIPKSLISQLSVLCLDITKWNVQSWFKAVDFPGIVTDLRDSC